MLRAEVNAASRRLSLQWDPSRTRLSALATAAEGLSFLAPDAQWSKWVGLAIAAATGRLRRNFQGYTDDTAPVLIGLGASSISRFPQGYAQNASGTSDHTKAIRSGQFSTHRGHAFAGEDLLRARLVKALEDNSYVVDSSSNGKTALFQVRLSAVFCAANAGVVVILNTLF